MDELREHNVQELLERVTVLRQLDEINERERAHLAGEVHDSLLQDIIAADMLLQGCEAFDRDRLKTHVEKARSSLRLGLKHGRRLIGELRSMTSDETGLTSAIESHAAEIESRSGIKVEVRKDVSQEIVSSLWSQTVFRIAQSAMNNVEDHSKAVSAVVEVASDEREFRLIVRDGGAGFDLESTSESTGLSCLRERARILGGIATVESQVDEGCTVSICLPLPPVI